MFAVFACLRLLVFADFACLRLLAMRAQCSDAATALLLLHLAPAAATHAAQPRAQRFPCACDTCVHMLFTFLDLHLAVPRPLSKASSLVTKHRLPPPCTSMSAFWAPACYSALNRPLQTLLDSANASCGVTVRCAAAAAVVCTLGVNCSLLVTLFPRRLLRFV